jgi:iron complex outermembrane receptor protein
LERATGDYVNLATAITVHPFDQHDIAFIIQGDNLLDEDIRHHTSFLKDLVPAPGRTFKFTVRAGF